MAKILTLTFNPCIDKSSTVEALIPEKKLRCTDPEFEPGGGGLNVARAIKKLGGEAMAIFPAGGYSGMFLQKLVADEGVSFKALPITSHTRENLIILDRSTNQQYRFGMPGPGLKEIEWQACLEAISSESGVDYIIASGSLAPGMPADIMAALAKIAKASGAKLVVDTSGEALSQAVEEGVFLVKPNLAELSALAGKKELLAEDVAGIAKEWIDRKGCEVMVVSMGAAGAMMVSRQGAIQMTPPIVKRKSTVGAGDSMVAGIVWRLSQGAGLEDALQYGIACGTAATLNEGTELCRKADVDQLYPQVQIVRKQTSQKIK